MADDEVYDEATPEQKINISTYFVMSAPTGEVGAVLEDVKILVNDPTVLTGDVVRQMMRNYNTSQMVAATAPDGSAVLVTPHGEVDATRYLDPATGKVLVFDHAEQKFTEETDQKQVLDSKVASFRDAVRGELDGYLGSQYKKGKYASAVYASDDQKLTVCVSAKNVKLTAFWTGGWRSEFVVDVSSAGETALQGNVKVHVHYFEDGNVQLHTDYNKEHRITVGDPAATAKSIVTAIAAMETAFQNALEDLYVSMHSDTFKAMRRFLPLTRQHMNWNTAAHGVTSEMGK